MRGLELHSLDYLVARPFTVSVSCHCECGWTVLLRVDLDPWL